MPHIKAVPRVLPAPLETISFFSTPTIDVEPFSLKTPVEETDKLLALHNKDENSILAAIKLGGLPMPSIAIVKARDGHTKYGPISLVFSKDTIDPQLFRANKVYGGDAWTPTAPRVDYPVNSKKASQVEHELQSWRRDWPPQTRCGRPIWQTRARAWSR